MRLTLLRSMSSRQKPVLLMSDVIVEYNLRNAAVFSKEEKSCGFCVFVYILFVFVYDLCMFVYVFLGIQSKGSYISRDFVVD